MAIIDDAMRYATLGYAVLPCRPGDKPPLTEHGLLDATTDTDQLERWWTKWPTANVAIRTGHLLVIDVDGKDNPWLSDQPDKLLELAAAPTATTPRGGRHHFYRAPPGSSYGNTVNKLAKGVDTRANGGFVLVAPSQVNGKPYVWRTPLDSEPGKLPLPPAWLVDLLAAAAKPAVRVEAAAPAGAIVEGGRNAALTSLAGTMRRVGMSADAILAALRQENVARCRPPLDDMEVETIAKSVARYEQDQFASLAVEFGPNEALPDETTPTDPGPTPTNLLRVPGFINDVIDFTLETAPYPEPALAFAAALPLQAFLASRKVQDAGTNRSNLYIVAAANSGAGKDWPRRVAQRVLQSCGLGDCCGDAIASGEGLEDLLFLKPSFLLLSDEFHYLLAAIKNGRDVRWQGIANVLLKLFTASADVYNMRIKASKEQTSIDQPGLTLCGSAIPDQFYDSLSPTVLTNGLFARLIIVEAGKRGLGRTPIRRELPESIVKAAKFWAEFQPGGSKNLATLHPSPLVVEYSQSSEAILTDFQADMDRQYAAAEANGDAVGMAVWGRANEKARRLALNYACSIDYQNPHLPATGATWACDFVKHQTRRMLFMASEHVAESEFDAKRQRLVRTMRSWQKKNPQKWMPAWMITRRLKGWTPREAEEVRTALLHAGLLERSLTENDGGGRPGECFRLR